MKKRLLALLVLTIVMTIAPAAMADHCARCRPVAQTCAPASNYGWDSCYRDEVEGICYVDTPCGDHVAALSTPLAAEFAVASVERLDEPQTAAAATLVAAAATPVPVTR